MQSVIKLTQYVCYVSQITIDKFMKKYKINKDMTQETIPPQFSNDQLRPIATALTAITNPQKYPFAAEIDFDSDVARQVLEATRKSCVLYEASHLPIRAVVDVPEDLVPALLAGLNFVADTVTEELPHQTGLANRKIRREMRSNLKIIAGITGALAVEN